MACMLCSRGIFELRHRRTSGCLPIWISSSKWSLPGWEPLSSCTRITSHVSGRVKKKFVNKRSCAIRYCAVSYFCFSFFSALHAFKQLELLEISHSIVDKLNIMWCRLRWVWWLRQALWRNRRLHSWYGDSSRSGPSVEESYTVQHSISACTQARSNCTCLRN